MMFFYGLKIILRKLNLLTFAVSRGGFSGTAVWQKDEKDDRWGEIADQIHKERRNIFRSF